MQQTTSLTDWFHLIDFNDRPNEFKKIVEAFISKLISAIPEAERVKLYGPSWDNRSNYERSYEGVLFDANDEEIAKLYFGFRINGETQYHYIINPHSHPEPYFLTISMGISEYYGPKGWGPDHETYKKLFVRSVANNFLSIINDPTPTC